MILYFFKSMLCQAAFLLVYLLFLEKEKMHRFNRWYLLGSIVFACIVPLISFSISSQSLPAFQDNYFIILDQNPGSNNYSQTQPASTQKELVDYLAISLLIVYSSATCFLFIRFSRNIYLLLSSATKNKMIVYRGAKLILLKEKTASHSFLNYIFISEEDYDNHSIEDEIITHELTHIRQKHSLDLIFIEILQAFFWFNPLLIFYKKAILLNHEYLADDAVIRIHKNITAYQYLLFEKVSLGSKTFLTSNFNYSVTKKRLVMMTRINNPAIAWAKKIFLVPVIAAAFVVFSARTVIAQDKPADPKIISNQPARSQDEWMQASWGKTPSTKEGISTELLSKYRDFEKKFDNMHPKSDWPEIADKEKYQMEAIFKQMSREQQKSCRVYYVPPIGPSKAEHPADTDLNRWAKNKIYGVLIDGKKIPNEELSNYSSADFSSFSVGLKLKEEFRKKFGYSYEVLLTTNEAFKQYNAARRAETHFQMAVAFTKAPADTVYTSVKY